ncbi:MAG: hypothetical protein AAGF97_06355, partial [Planctomycetota bacterium]
MLTAATEWTYVHPDHADTDYVLKVSGESLVIVSEITEQVLASTPAAGIEKLTILGGAADDNLIVDLTNGNPIPSGGLVYDGGAQDHGDALELRNHDPAAGAVDLIHYTFWNAHDGHIVLDNIGEVTFLGLEPIIDNLDATDRVFDFTAGTEVIRVFDDAVAGNNMLTVDSNLAEEVTFPAPTNSLTLNMGDGPNVLDIESLDSAFEVPQFNINGGEQLDQVFVQAAAENTALNISLFGGEDLVFIQTTAAGGQTNIDTGAGNDRVSIAEANSPTSSLDAILSGIVIEGGANDASSSSEVLSVTVEGKETNVVGQVAVDVVAGDVLEIVDSGSQDAHNYVFSGNRFQRTSEATGNIDFTGFETIEVITGQSDDTVVVSATAAQTQTHIDTAAGTDTVSVLGTGDDSLLEIELGDGMDTASVSLLGNRALARLEGGAQDDQLTLSGSGFQAGVELDGGAGSDLVDVQSTGDEAVVRLLGGADNDQLSVVNTGNDATAEVQGNTGQDELLLTTSGARGGVALRGDEDADTLTVSGTGDETLLYLDGAGGQDELNVQATGLNSITTVFGGAANDTINVSSDAPNNTGTLDGIQGEICIEGGTHDDVSLRSESVSSVATAKQTTISTSATATTTTGDTLRIADQGNTPQEYVLTGNSLVRGVDQTFDYEGVETIELTSGASEDTWFLGSTLAATHTTLVTGTGADTIRVLSTGNDSFLGIETGAGLDSAIISSTGTGSVTRLNMGTEADTVTLSGSGMNSGIELFAGQGHDEITVASSGDGATMRLDAGPAQDEVLVQSTGVGSSTTVRGGAGFDLVQVDTTGAQSGVLLDTGDDADSLNILMTGVDSVLEVRAGAGLDAIRLQGTGEGSRSDLFGGTESDTFNLFDGDFAGVGTLEQMFGEVCVFGESESSGAEGTDETVSAELSVKEGEFALALTPTVTLTGGDALNILDRLATSASYSVTADSFQRLGGGLRGLITHSGIEELYLESGDAPDAWSLDATPDVNSTTIRTGDGDDQFEVESASDDRYLSVELGGGNDAARFDSTGDRSVTRVSTGAGIDGVTVVNTGLDSGLQLDMGTEDDLVVIDDSGQGSAIRVMMGDGSDHLQITQSGEASVIEASLQEGVDSTTVSSFGASAGVSVDLGQGNDAMQVMATGAGGGLAMRGAEGNDLLAVETTAMGSLTDMFGGDGLDTFNIFASDSTLNGLLGEICVDGGGHAGAGTDGRQQATEVVVREGAADEFAGSQEVMVNVGLGDRLFVTDGGSQAGANYVLTAVRLTRTVEAQSPLSIDFTEIEDLDFRTGSGDDGVTVSGGSARTSILTRDGADTIRVLASQDDSLLTIDTGEGADTVTGTLSGRRAFTTLRTRAGDDVVSVSGFGVDSGAEIETGRGFDQISVASSPENGNLVIATGPAADSVEIADTGVSSILVLETGEANDEVTVGAVNSQSGVMIDAGADADEVRIESLNLDAGVKVFGGNGADTVSTTLGVLRATTEFWGNSEQASATPGNRLDLFESLQALDVAEVPTDFAFQFDTLGLSADVTTTVSVAPDSFGGFDHPFRIAGGDEDELDLMDVWEFDTTGFVGEEFYNQLNAEGTLLRISGFSPWQKPVDPLDINNNGVVDPLDALLLIGMLGEIGVLP